jgi:hypothetical protein
MANSEQPNITVPAAMSPPGGSQEKTKPAPEPSAARPTGPRIYSPLAGFLSYLVPGLGQIYQGRIRKGLLFLVCLYGMFFTGLAMGSWRNVYLADVQQEVVLFNWRLPNPLANLYHRLHYAGQFWIGVAAWPALWQYNKLPVPDDPFWKNFERGAETPAEQEELNQQITNSDKTPDLAWVYTVIAGVLNILVIYDAAAGPAFGAAMPKPKEDPKPTPEAAVS